MPDIAADENVNSVVTAFTVAKTHPRLMKIIQGAHAHEDWIRRNSWMKGTHMLRRRFSDLRRVEQLKDLVVVNLVHSFVDLTRFVHDSIE